MVTATLEVRLLRLFLDVHVLELAGLEDLATLYTLDKFGVFIATDNLYAQMFAGRFHTRILWRNRRLGTHRPVITRRMGEGSTFSLEFPVL